MLFPSIRYAVQVFGCSAALFDECAAPTAAVTNITYWPACAAISSAMCLIVLASAATWVVDIRARQMAVSTVLGIDSDSQWLLFLSRDTSLLGSLYRPYEFRVVVFVELWNLVSQIGLVVATVVAPTSNGLFLQLLGVALACCRRTSLTSRASSVRIIGG